MAGIQTADLYTLVFSQMAGTQIETFATWEELLYYAAHRVLSPRREDVLKDLKADELTAAAGKNSAE